MVRNKEDDSSEEIKFIKSKKRKAMKSNIRKKRCALIEIESSDDRKNIEGNSKSAGNGLVSIESNREKIERNRKYMDDGLVSIESNREKIERNRKYMDDGKGNLENSKGNIFSTHKCVESNNKCLENSKGNKMSIHKCVGNSNGNTQNIQEVDTQTMTKEQRDKNMNNSDDIFTGSQSERRKVIIRYSDEERIYYLKDDETLDEALENSEFIKLKYNNVLVSKYLTLEEIGFDTKNPYFDVVENEKPTINLKVNVGFFSSQNIKIEEDKKVSDINDYCKTEGIIVLNGVIIDLNRKIKDVLENNDVIDIVKI